MLWWFGLNQRCGPIPNRIGEENDWNSVPELVCQREPHEGCDQWPENTSIST